jgi:hypothetical protein
MALFQHAVRIKAASVWRLWPHCLQIHPNFVEAHGRLGKALIEPLMGLAMQSAGLYTCAGFVTTAVPELSGCLCWQTVLPECAVAGFLLAQVALASCMAWRFQQHMWSWVLTYLAVDAIHLAVYVFKGAVVRCHVD